MYCKGDIFFIKNRTKTIEVCRKYQKILDMLIKEHCLEPSYTGEMYAEKVKELMNQELS